MVSDKFQLVCHRAGSDLPYLRKIAKVTAISESWPETAGMTRYNSLAILQHPGVEQYLTSLGKVGVFVYKTSERVDRLCDERGYQLIANRHEIRDKFENKKDFRVIGKKMGLKMIGGETIKIDDLSDEKYGELVGKMGDKLVLQLTELSRGGGSGTFFINNKGDLEKFREVVAEKGENREEEEKLTFVNVTQFVEGIAGSITGCVTREGVLTGVVQTQVVDVPELVRRDTGRSGVFRGHDWSVFHYSDKVQRQAEKMAEALGGFMAKEGYKGIFGIDLIIDRERDEVYPVECNPRYTGAFPVYSLLQAQANEVPLDVFQLLEFLGVDYAYDFEAVNQSWKTPKFGAHLVLHNRDHENWVRAGGELAAGVYRFKVEADDKVELTFLREGFQPEDLRGEDELVLTDGVPYKGDLIKPHLRCGKLIFAGKVLNKIHDQLTAEASAVVKEVYRRFDFQVVDVPEDDWRWERRMASEANA